MPCAFALAQGNGLCPLAIHFPHFHGCKEASGRRHAGVERGVALVQVTGETTREILPALRDLHFQDGPGTSASTLASVEPFITARKLYGLPVSVHYKGLDWHDDCSNE
jgi:hypothetical protein